MGPVTGVKVTDVTSEASAVGRYQSSNVKVGNNCLKCDKEKGWIFCS